MKIKDIMSKDVICCDINDSIKDVCNIMKKYDVGFIVVYDNDKICGCLTDRDIVLNYGNEIKDIISSNLITIKPSDTLRFAAEIMGKNKIKRIIVIDEEDACGVVSLSDLIRYIDCYEEIKKIYSIDKNDEYQEVSVDDFEL